MIKAIILDDELRGGQSLLRKLAPFTPELDVLAVFTDPLIALVELPALQPDVLFLDIEMPHLNGFEFLERLGAFPFDVIFTTAYSSYAVEALRVSAVDYLLKPIDDDELDKAISRLKNRLATRKNVSGTTPATAKLTSDGRLPLSTQQGVYLIKLMDIVRVEAMSNYSAFYLANAKKIVVSRTLKEYETLLPDDLFMRVNRSVILNLSYVVKYRRGEGGTLELIDGTEIEVSSQKKATLMKQLMIEHS